MQDNDFGISDGVLEAYLGDTSVGTLVIPEGVKKIGDYIFQNKMEKELTIVLPSTLETINKNAFYATKIKCLDFSKCKIIDYNDIAKEVFAPETIIIPDTIIKLELKRGVNETNKVTVYSEGKLCELGDFSKCTNLKVLDLSGAFLTTELIDTCVLPDSLEKFILGGYRYRQGFTFRLVKFSSNSKIKEINASDIEAITVPSGVKEISAMNASWVFFEGTSLDLYNSSQFLDTYIVDNVDIDSIKFVDEMATKGVKYYETSKGIYIAELNNNIAKFEEIPTEYDGKNVLAMGIYNPFPQKNYYNKNKSPFGNNIPGELKSKIEYKVNMNRNKANDIVEGKLTSKANHGDDGTKVYEGYKLSKRKRNLLYLLGAFISYLVVALFCVAGGLLASKNPGSGPFVTYLIPILPVGFFITLIVDFFVFALWIIPKMENKNFENTNWEEVYAKKLGEIKDFALAYEYIAEPYRWMAYAFIKDTRDKIRRQNEEMDRLYKETADIIKYGTKEQRQRRELNEKLDAINNSLKENNSQYNVYNKYGDKIGEVKKDD